MRSSAPSIPITIPTTDSNNAHRRNSSSSSDDEEDFRSSALSAMERADSLSDLQVGSLPMHLRRSRRGSGTRPQYYGTASGSFLGPSSLPPPRAPILSSRGSGENLSRIPDMLLPESAASTDPELSESAPYGSLRESKFAHPGFGFERMQGPITQQQSSNSFQPQSLPAYGGIGSYFPMNNNLSRDSINSGIGSLIEESDEIMMRSSHSQSETISGLSQVMSSGLHLNEQENNSDGLGGLPPINFHEPPPNNRATNNDPEPLSSSLTALDMLTRMRQSPDRGTANKPINSEVQPDSSAVPTQPALQQQLDPQQMQPLHHFNPNHGQYLNATESSTRDEEIEDYNPDIYGAFDFED